MTQTTPSTAGVPSPVSRRLEVLRPGPWHRRLTAVVGVGAFFDLYEVFLGGVLAAALAEPWHLSQTQKSWIIAAGFLGMFVGANVMSLLADRFGRRRMFLVNLGMYSAFSLLCAAAPDVNWLIAARFLAGLGLGAELVLVDTYLSELLPTAVRGRYIAWAYTVGFFGVPLAALLGARLVAEHEIAGVSGWRWLLVAGAFGAFCIQWMRRTLPESPRWLEARGRHAEAEAVVARIETLNEPGTADARPVPAPRKAEARAETEAQTEAEAEAQAQAQAQAQTEAQSPAVPTVRVPLRRMFQPPYRRRTVMWWIFQVLQTVGYYGFGSLAPVVLAAKGHSTTASLGYAALSFCGYPLGSALSIPLIERFERRTLIIVAALGQAAFGLLFGFADAAWLIVGSGFLLTVCSNVFSNAFHVYQAEIFPTNLRSSAIGIAYSLSRLVSVVLPFIALSVLDDLGAAAVFTGSAALMVLLCLNVGFLGPKTKGLALDAI
ncbi:MFS transporter [Streptomyces sp. NBC_00401]|uniref:MFS transporter n=1 Tax=Streptomyces sp. NBC_00401 TaxID=2975738 RepID=UPI002250BF6B|nr:MFS transporter [Streptomyces sp. NBC_00401]MCX5084209.1 MFS transporter [Streptomyces sp. NBC_00401]